MLKQACSTISQAMSPRQMLLSAVVNSTFGIKNAFRMLQLLQHVNAAQY